MKLERILLIIIGALLAILICGTLVGLNNKKHNKPEVLISEGKAENLTAPKNTDVQAYYELGSIRIVTASDAKDETGTAMVISPWLGYPEGDTVFYEEIARKRGVIKGIFSQYFTEHSRSEILTLGETRIEEELKAAINAQLALGKISDIYFTDFLFLE